MRIYDLDDRKTAIPDEHRSVALGNFDGFHLGHQELLLCTQKEHYVSGVLLFRNHTSRLLSPNNREFLTSIDDKLAFLERFGTKEVFLKTFDEAFMNRSKESFMQEFLTDRMQVSDVVIGNDYRFGKGGRGSVADLVANSHFEVTVVPDVLYEESRISSSRIREAIRQSDVTRAADMLGRYYAIKGLVQTGASRGTTLGFPTANLELSFEYTIPGDGVYLTRVHVDGKSLFGMTNIGTNPTFTDEKRRKIETNILDFTGDLYGKEMVLKFLKFERKDMKFEGRDALIAQMKMDEKIIRGWIKNLHF